MPVSRSARLPMIAIAACLIASTASAATTARWEKRYDIKSHAVLDLLTHEGNVTVRTWDQPAVEVRVSTTGWRIGERGVQIEEHQEHDRVTLELRTPGMGFSFGFLIHQLRIEVWTPRESDLTLKTGDGNVAISAVRGRLSVRTGDGSITVDGARGEMRLSSGDGRIVGRGLDGALEANTGDGSVRIDGRFDRLTLSSGDGGISAEVLPGSQPGSPWSLTTNDGGVTLLVPPDLKAELEAHTGDGSIDIDLPLTISGRVSHQDVRGTLNGGGPLLRLRSGDGSIRISGR